MNKKFQQSRACKPHDEKAFDHVRKTVRLELAITLLNEMLPDKVYKIKYSEEEILHDDLYSNLLPERIYTLYAYLTDEFKGEN